MLSIGETVRVKVLDIDRDRQRISLGLKQTQEDPWQTVLNEYKPNDILEGKVTKVVAFGAFVEIVPGVEGLVHISELAEHHVETPSEVVQPGQETWVRILEIDEERRRISLSVKRAQANDNLPLRDLIPPELQPDAQPPAREPEADVPDLDLSEEVFSEARAARRLPRPPPRRRPPRPPVEEPPAEESPAEPPVEEPPPTNPPSPPPRRSPRSPRSPLSPSRSPRTARPRATSSPPPEPRAVAAAQRTASSASPARSRPESPRRSPPSSASARRRSRPTTSSTSCSATARVRDLLVERWGEEVAPGGEVDRGRVGAIVFERPDELAWLESTLHPLVGERIVGLARARCGRRRRWPSSRCRCCSRPGWRATFDATIGVIADDELRAERAGARGTGELEGRERRQLDQDEKAGAGDLRDRQRRLARRPRGGAGGGARRARGVAMTGARILVPVVLVGAVVARGRSAGSTSARRSAR